MLKKIAFGLALALAAASSALAATRTHIAPSQNTYNPSGAYVGTDPDPNVRFELNRDWTRGR